MAETLTLRQGTYQLADVAEGDYTIEFSLPGFIAVRCPVQVRPGSIATVSAAVALSGFDMGEPPPSDERRRLCFGTGEVPVFLGFIDAAQHRGTLILVADVGHAPRAAGHFLKQVGEKAFDQGTILRIPTPPMPGAAARAPRDTARATSLIEALARQPAPEAAPLMLESTRVSGLLHRAGTLSWPQAAASQPVDARFMILLDDDPSFDAGGTRYVNREGAAAFGRLAGGLADLKTWGSSPLTIVSLKPAGWLDSKR